MNDPNLMRDFIKEAAKNAAMEVATELRKDLSKAYERMGRIENIVGVGHDGTPTGNGLKGSVEKIERRCAVRATDCESKFIKISALASGGQKQVNIWKERAKGAAFALSTAGGIVAGIIEIHQFLK